MAVSAERGPRGVEVIIDERWISRYQPPSGCGSSPRRAIRSLAFVGIGRRNLRHFSTGVTPVARPDWPRGYVQALHGAHPDPRGRPPARGLSFLRVAMTRRNKILVALGVLVVMLVAARLALPYAVKDYANRRLAELDAYQ